MSMFDSTLDRRHLLRVGAVSTAVSMSGWMGQLALAAEAAKTKPKRSCILLWMNGGPSTIDLWDLKPGHENGGPYKEIATKRPGSQDRRAPAEDRQARRPPGHPARHVHQGRRPRARHLPDADGSASRRGRHPVPEHRRARLEGTRRRRAELPNFISDRPAAVLLPGSVRAWLPRPRSTRRSSSARTRTSTTRKATASTRS